VFDISGTEFSYGKTDIEVCE